ncbi:glycoside hydrolase family 2, partial [Mycobacterium tuberculosis]|nr:glycoside hydrolase family 2 [Mycobacterium tuberculosis]
RMVGRFAREWLEVVERDRSHPCIVTWVPLNESWGVPNIAERADQRAFASALYHLTRAVDPTRPVISNDGWEHTVSDVASVHD